MAKRMTKRKQSAKKGSELAKRDKAKDSEFLATITRNGEELDLEKWHISDICIPPNCIAGSQELAKEHKDILELKFEAIKVALFSE